MKQNIWMIFIWIIFSYFRYFPAIVQKIILPAHTPCFIYLEYFIFDLEKYKQVNHTRKCKKLNQRIDVIYC